MRTTSDTPTRTTATPRGRWTPLALGVGAVLAVPLVGGVWRILRATLDAVSVNASGPSPGMLGVASAIALAGAGLVFGVRALRGAQRSWPVWLGTLLSGTVALFWVAFTLGEILFPH